MDTYLIYIDEVFQERIQKPTYMDVVYYIGGKWSPLNHKIEIFKLYTEWVPPAWDEKQSKST